jgi:LysR family hydrogen peroxide-inducible transcriptional activator
MHLPSLRQLQFLLAIAERGSFSAAADHMAVTQPTLSAAIRELEDNLGVQLLERGRSGASLTAAGEIVATRAARVISEAQDLVQAARGAGEPLSGLFRLGAIPTIAPFLLPRVLPVLRERFPDLRLYLREDLTGRLLDALRGRSLDAALIALPYDAAGVETLVLAEDEFLLITPEGHPLMATGQVQPAALTGQDLLLLEDGHCLRDHSLSVCGGVGSVRTTEMGATSLHTLVQMVAGGMGVSLLPRIAADAGITDGTRVAVTPFAEPLIGRSIGLAWRKGSARAAEVRLIGEVLQTAFQRA